MDFNTLLDNSVVNNLKCSLCKNYLSCFPVYLTATNENICGRCSVPEEVIAVRNKVYELVATTVMFPCRYVTEGCIAKQYGDSMSIHEKICRYRLSKCPASQFNECHDEISLPNLQEHCENLHSKFLLKGEFAVDLSKSQEINHILMLKNNFYILRIKFNYENTLLSFRIYCFDQVYLNTYCDYNLYFSNGLQNITIGGPILLNNEEVDKSLCIKSMNLLSNNQELKGKITLLKNSSAPVKNKVCGELLRMFRCSNCSKYIMPPVKCYFSDVGTTCYSCGASRYSSLVKGDSLDIVAQKLDFPCEYQKSGCTWIAAPHILQNHQQYCLLGPSNCPLSEYDNQCKWTGLRKDVVSHINENHPKMIATSSRFLAQVSHSSYSSYTKCYIIKFSKYYFRLNFSSEREYYRWTVQMIGEFTDRFKYELEIFKYGESKRLVAVQCCQPLTPTSDVFKNIDQCCIFHYDQIKSFLNLNQINFEIRILQ